MREEKTINLEEMTDEEKREKREKEIILLLEITAKEWKAGHIELSNGNIRLPFGDELIIIETKLWNSNERHMILTKRFAGEFIIEELLTIDKIRYSWSIFHYFFTGFKWWSILMLYCFGSENRKRAYKLARKIYPIMKLEQKKQLRRMDYEQHV